MVRDSRRQASWDLSRSGRTECRICRQNLKKTRAVGPAVNEKASPTKFRVGAGVILCFM